jgi:hypothetical protein
MHVHASSRRISLAIAIAAIVAQTIALPGTARADDDAAASALFDEGKALFAAGRYGAARDRLEASYELSPLSGTAGLLAACHERTGKLASAWARYRDAAVLAERSGNHERAAIASAKAADLEPRLARLRIDRPAGALEGLVITRNDSRVPDAALGRPMPVDAGTYTLAATAPGHQAWSQTITIRDGERRTIAVPPLESPPVVIEQRPGPTPRRPAQKWIGLAIAGVGGAAMAAGGGFGLAASSAWNDAKDAGCSGDGVCPDDSSRERARTAGSRADLATGLVIGGVGAVAAGLIVYFTAPDGREQAPVAGVSASVAGGRVTVGLEGRF